MSYNRGWSWYAFDAPRFAAWRGWIAHTCVVTLVLWNVVGIACATVRSVPHGVGRTLFGGGVRAMLLRKAPRMVGSSICVELLPTSGVCMVGACALPASPGDFGSSCTGNVWPLAWQQEVQPEPLRKTIAHSLQSLARPRFGCGSWRVGVLAWCFV